MSLPSVIAVAVLVALAVAPGTTAEAKAPNDAYWGKQWGLRQIGAPKAWSRSTGAGQTIAIVDTGIDLEHPDLRQKIAGGATFAPCPAGPRPCGDGDWESGRRSSGRHRHGTQVAGIAAAATDNWKGIAGAAPDAELLAVKVGVGGFRARPVARGVRWAANHGADVINLSLGFPPGEQLLAAVGAPAARLKAAVAHAYAKGAAVVAAAGNDLASLCATPAFHRGALCVVATDRFRRKAWYSNLGVKRRLDVVAAPGGAGGEACEEGIITTLPTGEWSPCLDRLGRANYAFGSGTSAAAPHVAGVAALLRAQGRSNGGTRRVIKATARTPLLGTGIYTPVYGWGIVDAAAAVAASRGRSAGRWAGLGRPARRP